MVNIAFDCGKLTCIRSTIEMIERQTEVLETVGIKENESAAFSDG